MASTGSSGSSVRQSLHSGTVHATEKQDALFISNLPNYCTCTVCDWSVPSLQSADRGGLGMKKSSAM